jgi:hypothetical protein
MSGPAEYNKLVKQELADEDARKASLEQRGLAVITTSGVLVTLLFALGALSTKRAATLNLDPGAAIALAVALVLFVLAAISAVVVNAPFLEYQKASPDSIKKRLQADPIPSEDEAAAEAAMVRIAELRSARGQNGKKANYLLTAMRFEVLAVIATSVAILFLLLPLSSANTPNDQAWLICNNSARYTHKPKSCEFRIGGGSISVHRLHWRHWGAHRAIAHGKSSASGRVHVVARYRTKVTNCVGSRTKWFYEKVKLRIKGKIRHVKRSSLQPQCNNP